jgi:ABC-2 type transport system permease protein
MIAALKAEFKKILTLRSTYIIFIACVAITFLFAFYGDGYKADTHSLQDPHKLATEVSNAIMFLSSIGGLVGLLLVTHEYRHNTIIHTLTASNSRSRVFIAKFIAVSLYAIAFSVFMGALSPLFSYLGVHLSGRTLSPQQFSLWSLAGQALFVGWGFMAMAFIIASIIRNQVGAIATVLLAPGPIIAILGLIFRHSQDYLPYNSLNAVFGQGMGGQAAVKISVSTAMAVSLIYIVLGWLVAWWLFIRRDAT